MTPANDPSARAMRRESWIDARCETRPITGLLMNSLSSAASTWTRKCSRSLRSTFGQPGMVLTRMRPSGPMSESCTISLSSSRALSFQALKSKWAGSRR